MNDPLKETIDAINATYQSGYTIGYKDGIKAGLAAAVRIINGETVEAVQKDLLERHP
jgi:hypothetical protein